MAINPLQLPSSQAFTSDLNLGQSLSQLGQVYKQAQNQQRLSDLGKGLASGSIDYRTAAGQVADMGDVTHTLQFLALAEQQKKQGLEQAAAADFSKGLSGLYGGQPGAAPTTPNPMPVPGAPVNVPAATAPVGLNRAPVMPTAKVWGDKEAEDAGLYEKPVQVASLASPTANDAGGVPMPVARPPGAPGPVAQPAPAVVAQAAPVVPASPAAAPAGQPGAQHVPILLQALANPNLPAGQKETAKLLLTEAFKNMKEPEKIQTLRAMQADPSLLEMETKLRQAQATKVNVGGEDATIFKELDKKVGDRYAGFLTAGDKAQSRAGDIAQMREISQRIGSQGATAGVKEALGPYAEALGIPVAGLSDIQTFSSIIQRIAPEMHVPGTGSQSDIEFKGLLKSMPQLVANPEARGVILDSMDAMGQFSIARADLVNQFANKEINRGELEKRMRELGDPLTRFREWRKANPEVYGAALKGDGTPPAAKTPDNVREVPMTKIEIDQSLANARAAVARNPAARDRIIQKLRENNIDPSGL